MSAKGCSNVVEGKGVWARDPGTLACREYEWCPEVHSGSDSYVVVAGSIEESRLKGVWARDPGTLACREYEWCPKVNSGSDSYVGSIEESRLNGVCSRTDSVWDRDLSALLNGLREACCEDIGCRPGDTEDARENASYGL